jgi:HSP20 family protein
MAKHLSSNNDWLNSPTISEETTEEEGQLAIDAYQTEEEVFINAPIAGVNPHDLEIGITDEIVTIKGKRQKGEAVNQENYFTQECYWGAFSRSYLLPIAVDGDHARASLKNGILTIVIPKAEKTKTRIIKVQADD